MTAQADPPCSATRPRDRLTLRRLLAITAGLAIGLGVFLPETADGQALGAPDYWILLCNAPLLGLLLPGPLFAVPVARRADVALGPGGWFLLAGGLGAWLLLPPALVARIAAGNSVTPVCLAYVVPLMGLWFAVARVLTMRSLRELAVPGGPWVERYGWLLMVVWSPLGAWHLAHFYLEVFR